MGDGQQRRQCQCWAKTRFVAACRIDHHVRNRACIRRLSKSTPTLLIQRKVTTTFDKTSNEKRSVRQRTLIPPEILYGRWRKGRTSTAALPSLHITGGSWSRMEHSTRVCMPAPIRPIGEVTRLSPMRYTSKNVIRQSLNASLQGSTGRYSD